MEKCIENLNNQGRIAYQMKCINSIIEHFGYDYEEWREILEYISDYTLLHNTFEKEHGIRVETERMWNFYSCQYHPEEILTPWGIPQKGTNQCFFPCRACGRRKMQFEEYGATYGLCVNVLDCKYVKENYCYHSDEDNKFGKGVYKKSYELFLRTDFSLLRVLNNIFSNDTDLSYDFFEEGRVVFLQDSLKALDELGIPYPDCDDIHEYAFGEENDTKRFSSVNLIKKHDYVDYGDV